MYMRVIGKWHRTRRPYRMQGYGCTSEPPCIRNSNAIRMQLLLISISICIWMVYMPPTEHQLLFTVDDHGLPRSQLLSFIPLAEVTPRESASLNSSSKILWRGLIRCPPLCHHLWPPSEVTMYSYVGSCSDFDGGGRVSRKGRTLGQISFWFSKILIKVTYLWCTSTMCHTQCKEV